MTAPPLGGLELRSPARGPSSLGAPATPQHTASREGQRRCLKRKVASARKETASDQRSQQCDTIPGDTGVLLAQRGWGPRKNLPRVAGPQFLLALQPATAPTPDEVGGATAQPEAAVTARTPGSPHPGQASDAEVTLLSAGVSQYQLFPHRAGEVVPPETGQHQATGSSWGALRPAGCLCQVSSEEQTQGDPLLGGACFSGSILPSSRSRACS